MKRRSDLGSILLVALVFLDLVLWWRIAAPPRRVSPELYFFDVGQGDSTLLGFPGGVEVLLDAGPPDRKALQNLEAVLSRDDRYLDLVLLTHPQLDHFGGLYEIARRYEIGAVLVNGRDDARAEEEWNTVKALLREKRVPLVVLGAGDRVVFQDYAFRILSPDRNWLQSGELNDTSLVALLVAPSFRALFTGDIGIGVEQYLLSKFELRADILKVPHHGSKYSSSAEFLDEVRPKVAIVEVGKKNRYGHPSLLALERLEGTGAHIFRTDRNGTVKILEESRKLRVFTER